MPSSVRARKPLTGAVTSPGRGRAGQDLVELDEVAGRRPAAPRPRGGRSGVSNASRLVTLTLRPVSLRDDLDDAVDVADLGLALGDPGLEQLLDARQALRDVLAGDAAGVERPHGQLRAGLADGLGGDDADRLADPDHAAGGEVAAVAHRGRRRSATRRRAASGPAPRRCRPRRSPSRAPRSIMVLRSTTSGGRCALLDLRVRVHQVGGGEPADEAALERLGLIRGLGADDPAPLLRAAVVLRVMTSCATSTRRRVRYPESAVRRAVSARPLRAPWVLMKYSRTVMPSRKLLRTGTSMIRPDGSAIRPRMAPSWPMLPLLPRAPESVIIRTGFSRRAPPSSGRRRPW